VQAVTLQNGRDGYTDVADAYIYASDRYRNYGSSNALYVRDGETECALIRFGLPASLPASAHIVDARLELYAFDQSRTGAVDMRVYALRRPWVAGATTWLLAQAGQPWGRPGASDTRVDRAAEPAAQQTVRFRAQWASFDITALVQAWVSGSVPTYGVTFRGEGRSGIEYRFHSSDATQSRDLRPRLVITYQVEGAGALIETPAVMETATAAPGATPSSTPAAGPTATPLRPLWCIAGVILLVVLLGGAAFLLRGPADRRRTRRLKTRPPAG